MEKKPKQAKPRLQFTKEELEDTAPAKSKQHPIKEAQSAKQTAKADAQKNASKKKSQRLGFEENKSKSPSRLMHTTEQSVRGVTDELHQQAANSNEDQNVAVEAALDGEQATRTVLQTGADSFRAHSLRKSRRKAESKITEQLASGKGKANPKATTKQPIFQSNPLSRWQQKRAIQKSYAMEKAGATASKQTTNTVRTASSTIRSTAKSVVEKLTQNPKTLVLGGVVALLLFMLSTLQACSPLAQSIIESIVIGTYPATENDVRQAERIYLEKEKELQDKMAHYERFYPGYDEYIIEADDIWHDPYVLIAIISAYFDGQEWTADTAVPAIEKYFDLQYVVTETITTETRYHTETRVGTRFVTDPSTHRTYEETYTYEVEVPYLYKTCTVKMENKDLSHLPVLSMSRHGLGMFALYMATHGNMEGIFSGPYARPLKDPGEYELPDEVLVDEDFATLMEEAEQYIGYPYVWGGDSPETSFDCSGFVSYVYTESGYCNTGRLGATGLYNLCRKVRVEDAQPGDIIFFDGTMGDDVDGITHCGIYVGNNRMLHCGSPIGYADLTESYWRQHFHSFGRVPN